MPRVVHDQLPCFIPRLYVHYSNYYGHLVLHRATLHAA